MGEMVIVYFSHSTSDYNDYFESKCIEKIIKRTAKEYIKIINPRTDIEIPDDDKRKLKGNYFEYMEMMKMYFFTSIIKCKILYAFKDTKLNKYTHGVLQEIDFAKNNNIEVIECQI